MAGRVRRRRRRYNIYSRPQFSSSPSPTSSTTPPNSESSDSSKEDILEMMVNQVKKKEGSFKIEDLESVNRITSLPIVETGFNYAGNIYNRLKRSNSLVNWTLDQAESTIHTAVDTAMPAVVLFKGPINTVDKILCKSLDIVEDRVPSINLPPEMIISNTKQYVTDVSSRIVKPVLKRADSVKEFGNTVLASKYTALAAETLDGALDVADRYVDKYLPAEVYDDQNTEDATNRNEVEGPAGKAYHTIHHVDRFSRKLHRRLTKRTLAEAKALKEQSTEAIHVLVYVAELIATDPKLALQKGKELWASLSKDEPENQAPVENLEQLIVLITRESARRVVHFINYTSSVLSKAPRQVTNTILNMTSLLLHMADSMVKTIHLGGVQRFVVGSVRTQARNITLMLKKLNVYITDVLETTAQNLQQEPEPPKAALEVPKIKVQLRAAIRNSNYNTTNTSNGIETNS